MKEQTRYWLKTANNDLSVIEAILERKDLTPMVAFHAQQAIEKSLKAVLEEKETNQELKISFSIFYFLEVRIYQND